MIVTRTKEGHEERSVFYALGHRHEIVRVYDKGEVLLATHITIEESVLCAV